LFGPGLINLPTAATPALAATEEEGVGVGEIDAVAVVVDAAATRFDARNPVLIPAP
jgi:hypothetical protein